MSKELKIGLADDNFITREGEILLRSCGFGFRGLGLERRNWVKIDEGRGFSLEVGSPKDVAKKVLNGDLNAGLVGWNDLYEQDSSIEYSNQSYQVRTLPKQKMWVMPLEFGFSELAVMTNPALPSKYTPFGPLIWELRGMRVATAFPRATSKFFQRSDVPVEIERYEGDASEILRNGQADAVTTLLPKGQYWNRSTTYLKLVDVINYSQAMLIVNRNSVQEDGTGVQFSIFWDKVTQLNKRIQDENQLRKMMR